MTKLSDLAPAQQEILREVYARLAKAEATLDGLLGEPSRTATVHFLEPIRPGDADGRRRLAELARGRIVEAIAAP